MSEGNLEGGGRWAVEEAGGGGGGGYLAGAVGVAEEVNMERSMVLRSWCCGAGRGGDAAEGAALWPADTMAASISGVSSFD
jgi:hypothetical protein